MVATNSTELEVLGAGSEPYRSRRAQITEYFDQTAVEHWRQLTSDTKVSRIRESVRLGRASMQQSLLSWLPMDLNGLRVLDAGCGTGTLSYALAQRGATVVGIDLSPQLVEVADRQRPVDLPAERLSFQSGDMLSPALGSFDYIVAMDSLIHYQLPDTLAAVSSLLPRCSRGLCLTYVPRTPLLAVMHAVGQWFPKDNRSPDVVPVAPATMRRRLTEAFSSQGWALAEEARVDSFFYKSCGVLLERGAA